MPPRGAQTSETEPQSSGSTSSAAPWCTDCGSSGTGKRRGSAISGVIPDPAIASASRSPAFLVTTSRRRTRAGLASASRTACSPNSQIASGAARPARSLSITQAGFLPKAPPPARRPDGTASRSAQAPPAL